MQWILKRAAPVIGVIALIVTVAATPVSRDDDFVYDRAYRIRIGKNPDYEDFDYDSVLPALQSEPHYWFGYEPSGKLGVNIAVAQRHTKGPIFYTQVVHHEFSSTWQAYTDHERWYRLSFKMQGLDEFDPDYPGEHNVFVNRDGDLALGGPAPTHSPSVWGRAPGTYLVCRREYHRRDVLAIRFAYSVLNETVDLPAGCVPVWLESRCAQLEPLVHNRTWNHEEVLDEPCVRDY
jgi:hypothetical protein